MDNVIIRPIQDELIDALSDILEFNNIDLDLYFVTLQPIEFTELDNISTKVKREEETGEKLSSHKIEVEDYKQETKYPHFMYNPKTGEKVEVNNEEEHMYYSEKGYTHTAPSKYESLKEEE